MVETQDHNLSLVSLGCLMLAPIQVNPGMSSVRSAVSDQFAARLRARNELCARVIQEKSGHHFRTEMIGVSVISIPSSPETGINSRGQLVSMILQNSAAPADRQES